MFKSKTKAAEKAAKHQKGRAPGGEPDPAPAPEPEVPQEEAPAEATEPEQEQPQEEPEPEVPVGVRLIAPKDTVSIGFGERGARPPLTVTPDPKTGVVYVPAEYLADAKEAGCLPEE